MAAAAAAAAAAAPAADVFGLVICKQGLDDNATVVLLLTVSFTRFVTDVLIIKWSADKILFNSCKCQLHKNMYSVQRGSSYV